MTGDGTGTGTGTGEQTRVRIPADVDRPDRILAGLTARQLAILAAAAVVLWAGYITTRRLLPLPVFAVLAVPFGVAAVAVAVGSVGGQPADRTLGAAVGFLRRPRRLVSAGDGLPPLPAWAGREAGVVAGRVPAPLRLPLSGIAADGTMNLGSEGCAVLCRASSVTFGLRTAGEQEALVAGFAGWLNALSEPVQLLIRATPIDLTDMVDRLVAEAPGLAHPGLEAAARAHAAFLAELAAARRPLDREVLLVLRQPPGDYARQRLDHRVEEAAAGLAAAGVSVTRLDGPAATACLLAALDPADPRPTGMAAPGAVVTGPASLGAAR